MSRAGMRHVPRAPPHLLVQLVQSAFCEALCSDRGGLRVGGLDSVSLHLADGRRKAQGLHAPLRLLHAAHQECLRLVNLIRQCGQQAVHSHAWGGGGA